MRSKGQIGHTNETEDKYHKNEDEVKCVLSCSIDCCRKKLHVLAFIDVVKDLNTEEYSVD
jgi:hypothetical protein